MTTQDLEKANELNSQIKKLESFLIYLKKDYYSLSISANNNHDGNYHSQTMHLKSDDIGLNESIENHFLEKLSQLKKQFELL